MQDVRMRIGTATLLTLVSFFSVPGAAGVFVWWLVFTPRLQEIRRIRLVAVPIVMIVLAAFFISTGGGDGLSYLVRMIAIVLIGIWLYSEREAGEFLHLGVWMLGNRLGFEMGMIAEMGMQMAESLAADLDRIHMAMSIKGQPWGVHTLVPAGLILVSDALARAQDTAELMAVRGFHNGGSLCPEFIHQRFDLIPVMAAIVVGFMVFVPVSEFLILYR
jgi:energy-coupling factor transporter transmembrane protein EcfT